MNTCAGVILAGGKSTRMGIDKSVLKYQGTALLPYMKSLLGGFGCEEVHISHPEYIKDVYMDCGPLGGIHASLEHLGGQYQALLYVPVDMPGLREDIINGLLSAPQDKRLVFYENSYLPCRLTADDEMRACIENILMKKSNLSLGHFFDQISDKLRLSRNSNDSGFSNINDAADWQEFLGKHDS